MGRTSIWLTDGNEQYLEDETDNKSGYINELLEQDRSGGEA